MSTRYKRPLASLLAFVLVFSALFTGVDFRSITGGSSALNALEEEQVPEEGNLETTGVETSGEKPGDSLPVVNFTKTASAVAGMVNTWRITLKMEFTGDLKNIVISDKLSKDVKFLSFGDRTGNTNAPTHNDRLIQWSPLTMLNATEMDALASETDPAETSETIEAQTANSSGPPPQQKKTLELNFLIELDNSVLVDQLLKTNDWAKVQYKYLNHKKWESGERTADSPKVNPVLLTVKKIYLDHKDKEIQDNRAFTITITGPEYSRTVNLKGGQFIVLNDIRKIGKYTVTEATVSEGKSDFAIEIKIDGVKKDSFDVLFEEDIKKGKDFL
ncbi:MAG: hypothetical protein GX811_02380, partial [Lentisphaerae bacterium]|nr:hypothetical protein [Lentisphaerota bacterium]